MKCRKPLPQIVSHGTRPVVITGGAGFIGTNLAIRLIRGGKSVLVLDSFSRPGVERNADELRSLKARNISIENIDVRSDAAAGAVREASAVVHLAAQVAVTTSMKEPREDFDVNARGTINMLEAARSCKSPPPFLFASTNKVYGDLGNIPLRPSENGYAPVEPHIRRYGISESWPLSFHTPYGCSKGAGDQYVLDYARNLGLTAASFRMSCIYGPRQLGTEEQGWVAHFVRSALEDRPITIFGDGQQVRDLLAVEDAVEIYARALSHPEAVSGRAFNIGGGPQNAVSLAQVLAQIARHLGKPIELRYSQWRPGDQRYYVSDTRAIRSALSLPTVTLWKAGLGKLAEWLKGNATGARRQRDLVGGAL